VKPFFSACLILISAVAAVSLLAQEPIPRAAFDAKTIAIVYDAKTGEVSDGARERLAAWGHFTVVDDADSADIVLRFDKKTDHEKQSSHSTDENGTASWSGGMSFSSQVHMRAYLKGSNSPFYTTQTGDSKKKAGASCVTNFEKAWNEAR
jgi:hypothetical protein